MDWAREARWAQGPGPLGPGARARAPPGPSPSPHKRNLRSCSSFFLKNVPPENHEKTTFRAFLETEGPRDLPCVKERNVLFRIALTRALYDQMIPSYATFTFQDHSEVSQSFCFKTFGPSDAPNF